MAFYKHTLFGLEIYLDDTETKSLIRHINSGTVSVTTINAALVTYGIHGSVQIIGAIINAVLGIGSQTLTNCNHTGRGVIITVLWVGVPWCKSQ